MKRQPPEFSGPLSRPFRVEDLLSLPEGRIGIEASEAERAALAVENGLPGVAMLRADLRIAPEKRGFHVSGEVRAKLTQTCVVTLEDFETTMREPVDADFVEPPPAAAAGRKRHAPPTPALEIDAGEDEPPEPIVNGYADLGKVVAEFFALGIDPYPRKPGAAFEGGEGPSGGAEAEEPAESPFAALARLKGQGPDGKGPGGND